MQGRVAEARVEQAYVIGPEGTGIDAGEGDPRMLSARPGQHVLVLVDPDDIDSLRSELGGMPTGPAAQVEDAFTRAGVEKGQEVVAVATDEGERRVVLVRIPAIAGHGRRLLAPEEPPDGGKEAALGRTGGGRSR